MATEARRQQRKEPSRGSDRHRRLSTTRCQGHYCGRNMIWAMRLDLCPKSTLCSPCVCLIDFPLYDMACRCEFPYSLQPPASNPPPFSHSSTPFSRPELCHKIRKTRGETHRSRWLLGAWIWATKPWEADHRSGGQRDLKSSWGGVTCLCSLHTVNCTVP